MDLVNTEYSGGQNSLKPELFARWISREKVTGHEPRRPGKKKGMYIVLKSITQFTTYKECMEAE